MTGTALVPTDDINKAITDLKASLCGLDPPEHRAKQCARMSELHDRINMGVYEAIIGPVWVSAIAAKRVGVKGNNPNNKKIKAAHEWVTEWHGYNIGQQHSMLLEARNPAGLMKSRKHHNSRIAYVTTVVSLFNAIAKVYDRSNPEERTKIREFCQEVQTWL